MKENSVLKVAYADDHTLVRKGIVALLSRTKRLEIVIEAGNGLELIQQIEKAETLPDVCIIDINMPEMNGFETILQLKKRWPEIGVLVLTVFDNEYYFIKMIMSGANGYLLKSCDPDEIRTALFSIYENGMYYSDRVARNFLLAVINKEADVNELTAMETLVLKNLCTDMSYTEISAKMGMSVRSIEGHRDNLFRQFGVNSRIGLVLCAVQLGIVLVEIDTSEKKNFF